ncbi:hypothetical protein AAZX31_04G006800 [Glycine max]
MISFEDKITVSQNQQSEKPNQYHHQVVPESTCRSVNSGRERY